MAFLAVLVPLLTVVSFLPDWLGIQDDNNLAFVIFLGLAITPAIGVWHLLTHAFRRRNLAREKNK